MHPLWKMLKLLCRHEIKTFESYLTLISPHTLCDYVFVQLVSFPIWNYVIWIFKSYKYYTRARKLFLNSISLNKLNRNNFWNFSRTLSIQRSLSHTIRSRCVLHTLIFHFALHIRIYTHPHVCTYQRAYFTFQSSFVRFYILSPFAGVMAARKSGVFSVKMA